METNQEFEIEVKTKITTIKIELDVKKELDLLKIIPRETYSQVIKRLINKNKE